MTPVRDPLPGEADAVWRMVEDDREVFTFGYTVVDLIDRSAFVWLRPGTLTARHAREIRRAWLAFIAGEQFRTAIAGVRKDFPAAQRFARFLGFEKMGGYDQEHDLYGYRVDTDRV